jgi:hypothetical protein
MKCPALFLLAAAALSGCMSDSLEDGAVVLQYSKLVEAGRRAESKGNVKIAEDTYGWLIGRDNRYGEYGLAMLKLRRGSCCGEAVANLLSCAKRSIDDTAMDSAFSAAAMAKLSDIAISEHDRRDIADSLRETMSGIVTEEVKAWANAMKTKNAGCATIYRDIISAVESCRQSREYVKVLEWDEISRVLLNEEPDNVVSPGGVGQPVLPPPYSVMKFVKIPGATCKYDFEVRLNGNGTFKETDKVQSDLRRLLMREFLAANPYDGGDDVRILISYRQLESRIAGSAVVMKVSAVRLEYDDATSRGKIAVRLDGRNVSAAKEWALKNIGELASGKNVVLVAGMSPPPGARYKAGSERMTEDGLLEIEFTTRPNNLE